MTSIHAATGAAALDRLLSQTDAIAPTYNQSNGPSQPSGHPDGGGCGESRLPMPHPGPFPPQATGPIELPPLVPLPPGPHDGRSPEIDVPRLPQSGGAWPGPDGTTPTREI